jgi:interferon gamma-inducible protein 30
VTNHIIAGHYNFTCQHGPNECLGNMLEQCVLNGYKNDSIAAFPVIYCMEKQLHQSMKPLDVAKACSPSEDFFNQVVKCTNGPLGNALMHLNAVETAALQPPHEYVPWIVVNGIHTEKIQDEISDDMLKFVCSHFKGSLPSGCTAEAKMRAVCYRERN